MRVLRGWRELERRELVRSERADRMGEKEDFVSSLFFYFNENTNSSGGWEVLFQQLRLIPTGMSIQTDQLIVSFLI